MKKRAGYEDGTGNFRRISRALRECWIRACYRFFCFRDNFVGFKDQLKGEDYSKLFSDDRLIRTEISTLIGLMARGPIDLSLPAQRELQTLIERSEALLKELHEAMMQPFTEIFKTALANPSGPDPFNNAEAMREPIFYGAESAYSFQYRDLAPEKYRRDEDWLRQNKGFSIGEARNVVLAVLEILNEKTLLTLRGLKDLPMEAWTLLAGFEFSTSEVVAKSKISKEIATKILDAFSFAKDGNTTFISLQEFNSTNA